MESSPEHESGSPQNKVATQNGGKNSQQQDFPGTYHPGLAENQPLLAENQAQPSHRSIGQTSAEYHLPNEVESSQGRSHTTRQKYREFVKDSKIILNVLIGVNLFWLTVTFIVDFFFNIGLLRFSNRLTSFNDLALIFVSIVANMVNLWSNRVGLYSTLDQALNVLLFSMTVFNLFLTLIISYTRRRIGFFGVFTYLWAALTFFAGAVLDWYLYYYFKEFHVGEEYEEAANAPQTSRHTLKEWMSIGARNSVKGVIFVFYFFFTLNTLLFTIDVGRLTRGVKDVSAEVATSYDAFHWVDKEHTYQLHITCYGDISASDKDRQPIVLFDHGS